MVTLIFLDAESGRPCPGILEAVLLRIRPIAPEAMDHYLVQPTRGQSGFKLKEMAQLARASMVEVKATPLVVLHDGQGLKFPARDGGYSDGQRVVEKGQEYGENLMFATFMNSGMVPKDPEVNKRYQDRLLANKDG